jgi:proton glutamate symport protein
MAYAVAQGDHDMLKFMNIWLVLKKRDGTIKNINDHWILGRGAESKEPRWSVIRNVLHWVK